ncbi:YbaB/EbfC family nucleoid-associated protein [Actinopolymorpha cephalotaxi]|uniref:DNA-binding protein YbaB n=1 Tax=Actinopolymorpha cephalotaxi TaxID=504797 RepID=A0ABX2S3S4_9ACTN|nr:YbaB/EbfC family nucleoid-associated protein [Actinopolymorpha cephalotaxi]NYH84280.1 DNA-binding protein YbaB [Actinopolymorpha cephalotaxi]
MSEHEAHASAAAQLGIAMTGDLRRDLEAVQARVDQVLAAVGRAQEQTFEATDESGTVSAGVSGSGELVGVEITPQAMRDLDATELAAACREAIQNARLGMAAGMMSALKETAGFDLEEAPDPADPREAWRQATKESGWTS